MVDYELEWIFKDAVNNKDIEAMNFCKHIFQHLQPGDCFTYGKYILPELDMSPVVLLSYPIVWKVLDKKENKLLVISDLCLDEIEVGGFGAFIGDKNTLPDSNWIQTLLEMYFNRWFSPELQTLITNAFSPISQRECLFHDGLPITEQDHLFLLSLEEAILYFSESKTAIYDLTAESDFFSLSKPDGKAYLCEMENPHSDEDDVNIFYSFESWLLRTRGISEDQDSIMFVDEKGNIDFEGFSDGIICIRPAMWLDINKINILINDNETK